MRYVAAYLLATLGGNKSPSVELIADILKAGGVDSDTEKISFLLKELEGKDINEVLKAGQEKMSKVASAGPAVSSAPVAAASNASAAVPKAADKPAAKEKTPEPSEEEGADGLLDFF